MKEKIVLISKDAMGRFYLPIYGNQYHKTPNIDELAKKGTVFRRHYTAAPSTAMAFISMFTGIYPFETNIRDYRPLKEEFQDTLFSDFWKQGYECHVLWDARWNDGWDKYCNVWGHTNIHWMESIGQFAGGGKQEYERPLMTNPELSKKAIESFETNLLDAINSSDKTFTWVHFPHVLAGSNCYGSDIEIFDECVGVVRKYVPDECIYLTSDHGNMNGLKGKVRYGFDVYEPAIAIPLITPRIQGLQEYTGVTSNVDLRELIINANIVKRDFVFSDSAYYAQPQRKIALVGERYKYIYNKESGTEELYDVLFDLNEDMNILDMDLWDADRKIYCRLEELYWYPYWKESRVALEKFREEKKKVWRVASTQERILHKVLRILKIEK